MSRSFAGFAATVSEGVGIIEEKYECRVLLVPGSDLPLRKDA